MKIKTDQYAETARRELGNPNSRVFLNLLPAFLSVMRQAAMQSFPDPAAAHAMGGVIRAEALDRLPELLEQFERNATAAGTKVFWAWDGHAANGYILDLALKHGIGYVTKGKSMITEEIGLNDLLEENGIEVWETDLGEFIAQLLGRPPFHIVGPAVNVPVEEIRDLFMDRIGLEKPTTDPVELGLAARNFLRDKFHHMEMGITGVNMAVAETGTIINVENEGNIRFNKSSPRIQVSVMSLEKVVPTMMEAMHLLRLLCRNCTGQELGAYVSLDTGPKNPDEIDGPEELHVIILDNGRTRLYQDPNLREILRCMRCGGCLNVCPIYRRIGGYPYGWAYSGPMGQILNPLLLGLDRTRDLVQSCTLCHACRDACMTGIDHPGLLLYLRSKAAEGDPDLGASPESWPIAWFFKAFAHAAANPVLWRTTVRLVRSLFNRTAREGRVTKAPGPLAAWLESRDFPAMPEKTFHERWADLERKG
ncbi:MAG: lactate utilization protein [Proteobacteria bacterium]|nr:lactate utilization protein [Pseudomonadota bacterium]